MTAEDRGLADEEILARGMLEFPNGGAINVHSISSIADEGVVYYARRMPNSTEWDLMRTSVRRFLKGVRRAEGFRSTRIVMGRCRRGRVDTGGGG